jgi:hypothetical protein
VDRIVRTDQVPSPDYTVGKYPDDSLDPETRNRYQVAVMKYHNKEKLTTVEANMIAFWYTAGACGQKINPFPNSLTKKDLNEDN